MIWVVLILIVARPKLGKSNRRTRQVLISWMEHFAAIQSASNSILGGLWCLQIGIRKVAEKRPCFHFANGLNWTRIFFAPVCQDGALLAGKGVFWLFCILGVGVGGKMQNSDNAMYMNKKCCLEGNLQWNDSSLFYIDINETMQCVSYAQNMIRPPVGIRIEHVKPMRINSVASIWHGKRTWFTGAIPEKFPSVDIPMDCGALEPKITGKGVCIWIFCVLHLPKPQTIEIHALRRFWCLDQSESATWESSIQRNFKMPQLWKAVCRGPINSRTQSWTMWNRHFFRLFIIDHWWLPFKAVTMTLWCSVFVSLDCRSTHRTK